MRYYDKIFLIPFFWVFVVLSINTKAELHNSAFISSFVVERISFQDSILLTRKSKNIKIKDSVLLTRKLSLAKKLYEGKDYSKSLKIAYKVLNSSKTHPLMKVKVQMLISDVFKRTGYEKKSTSFLRQAWATLRVNRSHMTQEYYNIHLAKIYFRLANTFFANKRKRDSAIYFHEKIVMMNYDIPDIESLKAKSYSTLSALYAYSKNKSKLKMAKDYAKKSLHFFRKIKDYVGLSAAYSNLANIYVAENKLKKARSLNLKALRIVRKDNSIPAQGVKVTINKNLATCLYKMKNYRACDYLNESFIIKDSLKTESFKKELANLDLKYNLDIVKREEENKRLRLEKSTWLISLISLIVVGILFYYLNNFKLRQKNLKLEQKRDLDMLRSEAQNKILNATLDGREAERKAIAETLHDNVSALLSSANMHLTVIKKVLDSNNKSTPDELKKTQEIISEAGTKIRDLSHTLMSSVLLKFGLAYAIKDVAKKFSNSQVTIHPKMSDIERYPSEKEIKLFNITQELINNSLKHSKAKNIYVKLKDTQGYLTIEVKDDGVGFDVENILKGGIGLNQIEARIKTMSGGFEVKSAKGEGTKITIRVPIEHVNQSNYS